MMIGDVLKIECTDPAMLARIRSIHLLTFHHPDDKRQRRTVVSLLYENDIQTTLVETYSRKEKELDVGEKHMSGTTGI